MNTGDKTDDRKHFMALADIMLEDIFESADDEIVQEIADGDEDLDALRKRMSNNVVIAKERAGERRLKNARAALERDRDWSKANVVPIRKREAKSRSEGFAPDTIAARNGKEFSDRDKTALDEDFDELFDDDAWGDDHDESDK